MLDPRAVGAIDEKVGLGAGAMCFGGAAFGFEISKKSAEMVGTGPAV